MINKQYKYFKNIENDIRKDINRGLSITKCATKYKISRPTLTKYLREKILEYISETKKIFLKNKKEIIKLYKEEKYSIKELSKLYNINRSSMRDFLKQENVYELRSCITERANEKAKNSLFYKYGVYNAGQIKESNKEKGNKISEVRKKNKTWIGENNPNYMNKIGNSYGFKGYFREDLNKYFRSSWEANFARILNYLNIEWTFEDIHFKINEKETYTPDFYLPKFNTYIEVKGYWFDDAKRKYNAFKNLYNYNIKLIQEKEYKWLLEKYKSQVFFE